MPAATLVSLEEFERLPDPEDGYLELHEGEVIAVSTPDIKHNRIEKALVRLLDPLLQAAGFCSAEQPFSVLWHRVPTEGVIQGSPDLVIEIDSSSNKESVMIRKRRICFASCCAEFWTVFPDERYVRVEPPGQAVLECWPGQSVPVPFVEGASISVDLIFEGIA